MGRVGDMLRHLHLPTQHSTNNVRQLSATEHYSAYKAAVELCFKPSSIDDAIADFFEWRKTTKS